MDNIKGSQNQIDWKHFLKSGDRIFIGSNAAVPNALMDQLIDEQASALNDIEVVHILTLGENRWAQKSIRIPLPSMRCFSDRGPGKRSMKDMPIILPVFYPKSPPCSTTRHFRLMWL